MKYFDGIHEAQKNQKPPGELPEFDMERLRVGSFWGRIVSRFLENPRWALRLLRCFWPIARIGRVHIVTRYDDVVDVLERQDNFHTPFGPEMTEMAKGTNFILGMQDGPEYRQMKSACLMAFPPDEVQERLRPLCRELADDVMRRAVPGFNPVHDLLKIVPARICRDYFGLIITDENEFADWSIALSSLFFADYFGSKPVRDLAVVAADRMNEVIGNSIQEARAGNIPSNTPIARLVKWADSDPENRPVEMIHSIMMGMVSGFVPTDLLAGGNCLDVILSRPEAQRALEEAIAVGDDKALDAVIREAMRFKPINIGPLRYVEHDTVLAPDTPRERKVRARSIVMPATLSAMFDNRAINDPENFQPGRASEHYLLFGHGIHWCIGSVIARTQIAECFKALFSQKNVRRQKGSSGKLKRRGAFPESLHVSFEPIASQQTVEQTLVTVIAEIRQGVDIDTLRTDVDALGNPARSEIQAAVDKTGCVHFMSLAVICKAEPVEERDGDSAFLLLELSVDGEGEKALEKVVAMAGEFLRPIFHKACAVSENDDLSVFLKRHSVRISPYPGGVSGLGFSGTPGHSVKRIREEARLYDVIQSMVRSTTSEGTNSALQTVNEVRRRIGELKEYDWALRPASSLLEKDPKGSWRKALTGSPESRQGVFAIGLAILVGTVLNYWLLLGHPGGIGSLGQMAIGFLALIASAALALIELFIIIGSLSFLLLFLLNRAEKKDRPSETHASLSRYEAVVERENRMGRKEGLGEQNHLTGLSVMKPGLLRRSALRFSFAVIQIAATWVFRPGYLSSINTIHFARWVLIPGTDKLVFLSNYGGSWESYLEDFINKARYGLTGVWSNSRGFPRSRWLFDQGASDGDRFKRWARLQQIPTLFWYCAYPGMDTRRIRINSAVRQGLARADTEQEARAWLSQFGSIPKPKDILETDEIQSLVFGPMGRLEHAKAIAFKIGEAPDKAAARAFLEGLLADTRFGDRLPEHEALICAFGPDGLSGFGLETKSAHGGLAAFPHAYRQTMSHESRARILDDVGDNAPEKWEWGSAQNPTDLMILFYADCSERLERLCERHGKAARAAGLDEVCNIALVIDRMRPEKAANGASGKKQEKQEPVQKGRAIEPFGFADGISQPVMEGTPRATRVSSPMHRLAAGEFVLGYRNELGYVPPPIAVSASSDPGCILPVVEDDAGGDELASSHARDFGKNGSFLVVRQLQQHVEQFHDFCQKTAKSLNRKSTDLEITPQWVGAKMVGRWQDGSSLVRNPYAPAGLKKKADNEFTYGSEDPQGIRCPLGSHIRRSNPRDSLGEDRERQIEIGKRHRILRVGRNYCRSADDGNQERGLLFMCLNGDIERQFEFVQQTWVSAPMFHGLPKEKDPLIASQPAHAKFTIPTRGGGVSVTGLPAFTRVRGGAYFFMPSRSALAYLVSRL